MDSLKNEFKRTVTTYKDIKTMYDSMQTDSSEMYGPALPPARSCDTNERSCFNERRVYGPTLPKRVSPELSESSEFEDFIGPSFEGYMDSGEKRTVRLVDSGRYSQNNYSSNKLKDSSQKRENWMVELPLDRTRSLGLGPRKFRLHEAPDMSQSYVWTDTPKMKYKREMEKINEGKKVMPSSTATKALFEQELGAGDSLMMEEMRRKKRKSDDDDVQRKKHRSDDGSWKKKEMMKKKSRNNNEEEIHEGKKVMPPSTATKAMSEQEFIDSLMMEEMRRHKHRRDDGSWKRDKMQKKKSRDDDEMYGGRRVQILPSATITSGYLKQHLAASSSQKVKKSLLEIHQEKRKAEIKRDKKENSAKEPRRPFSRDNDLQVRVCSEADRKVLIKSAQMLNSKFSNGEDKFL